MKKVIFISGTMGSGKSTISRLCSEQLTRSVWLDGDWCWMMHPFQVSDQTKAMVLNNITYLLNQFLAQPDFDYILFSWVRNDPEIVRSILKRLHGEFTFNHFTLSPSLPPPSCAASYSLTWIGACEHLNVLSAAWSDCLIMTTLTQKK